MLAAVGRATVQLAAGGAPPEAPRIHWQRPSTQVPWPLQSDGWQRGSCTHTTVDTWRGQRHMLSWLQKKQECEERLKCWPPQQTLKPPTAAPEGCLSLPLFIVSSPAFYRFFPPPTIPSTPGPLHMLFYAQKALPCPPSPSSSRSQLMLHYPQVFPDQSPPSIGLRGAGTLHILPVSSEKQGSWLLLLSAESPEPGTE